MSHEFLNFILALGIIIVAAKGGGYLSVRLNQPSVLGELLVGLVLGPTLLNMFHVWPVFSADENLGEAKKIDLIVMSSNGRSGIDRLVFGSVTDKVIR